MAPLQEGNELKPALWKVIAVAVACAVALGAYAVSAQGERPPIFFSGQVTVAGDPAPDGMEIFVRVNGTELTEPYGRAIVGDNCETDGCYTVLQVPYDLLFVGDEIHFYTTFGPDEVEAAETTTYRLPTLDDLARTQNLTFSRLPAPPPTPTPSPTPTMTPTPTPALPIPGDPMVGTVWTWVLAVGALGLIGGLVALRLARAR